MNWLDLTQAIQDTGLELGLTIVFVAGMFFAGLILGRWSLRMQINAEQGAWNISQKEITLRKTTRANFIQGISTELFGAVLTTVAFGVVLLIFQQYQFIQNRKAELMLQLGSPDNSFAIEAWRQIQVLGWDNDGTLTGGSLYYINLQNASLHSINLQGTILINSNFSGSNMNGANLQDVSFVSVNLRDTQFRHANLQNSTFNSANLRGANLSNANLQNVIIVFTEFDGQTILPDGTNWTSDTDMNRFTNPDHPNFWQPNWVEAGFDNYNDWFSRSLLTPNNTNE